MEATALASKTTRHVSTSTTVVNINFPTQSSPTPSAILCALYSPTAPLATQSSYYSVKDCGSHMENCPEEASSHPGAVPLYSSSPSIPYCSSMTSSTVASTLFSSSTISNSVASNASAVLSSNSDESQCHGIGCSPRLAIILGSTLGGAAFLAIALACFLMSRRRRRTAVMAEEPLFETREYSSLEPKPESSNPLIPIVVTDITNAEIEAELNDISSDITELAIAVPPAASRGFDPEVSRVFINTIQGAQGGHPPEIATGKTEASQALQAAIAMLLTDRVLPQDESYPQHPLMRTGDRREFDRWVKAERGFEGMSRLTPERRRLWVAKYVKENLATSALLISQRQAVMEKTTNEIISAIDKLYEGWDHEKLRSRIENLVEKALGLSCEIMGKDLSVTARWILPGEPFDERLMDMTDLEKVDELVALCLFPMWVDSEGLLVARGKVYCA